MGEPNGLDEESERSRIRRALGHHAVRWPLYLSLVGMAIAVVSGALFVAVTLTEGADEQAFLGQLWSLFDVDAEHNIAAWYSSMLWMLLGVLALASGARARRHRASWRFMAAAAFFFSIDESAQLHERLNDVGRRMAGWLPFELVFPWVLIGVLFGGLIVLVLGRLVLSLPAPARTALVVGGLVFFSAVVVVETLSGQVSLALGSGAPGTSCSPC